METNNNQVVDSLNNLIQINNDRIQGYITAANETDESDLKNLFSEMLNTSQECRRELTEAVVKLGGTPVEGTTTSGKIYRVWMDVRAALTSKDRTAILNSCEFGEDAALKTYEMELNGEALNNGGNDYTAIVREQQSKIRSEHDRIKALRDASK